MEEDMHGQGIVALATSGTFVAAYHVLQPGSELGVTPEMLDWRPGWMGWGFGAVASILILAVIIGIAMHLTRWLIGPRDRT